eukprot:5448610-Ditylum_brightwellii.AAC.1
MHPRTQNGKQPVTSLSLPPHISSGWEKTLHHGKSNAMVNGSEHQEPSSSEYRMLDYGRTANCCQEQAS